jgi:dTMP kinase
MAPTTETLLFAASRAQLVSQVIRPYLGLGGIVLCDRYADSTYAYQGYGLGRDLDELRAITAAATGGLLPDVTVYLDLTAEEGLERKRRKRQETAEHSNKGLLTPAAATPRPNADPADGRNAAIEWNRLDARELAYHQRVADGYQKMIAQEPERWLIFDARQPVEELAEQISQALEPWLEHIQTLETTSP